MSNLFDDNNEYRMVSKFSDGNAIYAVKDDLARRVIEEHIEDTIDTEDGVHGLRYTNDILAYKNSSTNKWENVHVGLREDDLKVDNKTIFKDENGVLCVNIFAGNREEYIQSKEDGRIREGCIAFLSEEGEEETVPLSFEDLAITTYGLGRRLKRYDKDSNGNILKVTLEDETLGIVTTEEWYSNIYEREDGSVDFDENLCRVIIDANGGKFNNSDNLDIATFCIREGATLNTEDLPVPKRDGKTFSGWYTSSEDGDSVSSIDYSEDRDVFLYAHWVDGADPDSSNNSSELYTPPEGVYINYGVFVDDYLEDDEESMTIIPEDVQINIVVKSVVPFDREYRYVQINIERDKIEINHLFRLNKIENNEVRIVFNEENFLSTCNAIQQSGGGVVVYAPTRIKGFNPDIINIEEGDYSNVRLLVCDQDEYVTVGNNVHFKEYVIVRSM